MEYNSIVRPHNWQAAKDWCIANFKEDPVLENSFLITKIWVENPNELAYCFTFTNSELAMRFKLAWQDVEFIIHVISENDLLEY